MAQAVSKAVAVARVLDDGAGRNVDVRRGPIWLECLGSGCLRVEHDVPYLEFLGVELGIPRCPEFTGLWRVDKETPADIG